MNNSIRQQQWKRVNKLQRIGLVSIASITSVSLIYYYANKNNFNKDPLSFKTKSNVNKQQSSPYLPLKDPAYTNQFTAHSILITNNNPKAKGLGLLQKIPVTVSTKHNIKELVILPTGNQKLNPTGYYIDSHGDLYKWDVKGETDKVLSNYNLTSIKYSNNQIYSLSKDGNIYIFPTNDNNLLNSFYSKSRLPLFNQYYYSHKVERLDNNKIVQFDTGKDHLLYIDNKGKAYAVPTRDNVETIDQFGIMDRDESIPLKINQSIDLMLLNNELSSNDNKMVPRKITKVACGENHSLALTSKGDILTFGNNKFGQLGHSILNYNHVNIPFPKQISAQKFKPYGLEAKPVDIFSMANTSFILLSNNVLLSLGDGQVGQLGNNTFKNFQCDPSRVKFDGKITSFITNSLSNHALLVDAENQIWGVGNNSQGQLMMGNHYSQSKPFKIETLPSNVDIGNAGIFTSTTTSVLALNK